MKVEIKLNPSKLWRQKDCPVIFIQKVESSVGRVSGNHKYRTLEKRREYWLSDDNKFRQGINSIDDGVYRTYLFSN